MRNNYEKAQILRLKEEIDQLRRERVIFDTVFKKLEYDLQNKENDLFIRLEE